MLRTRDRRKFIILALLILCNTIFISSEMVAEEEDSLEKIQEELLNISSEEREILDSLFIQAQEIEELEMEKERITLDIGKMKKEIGDLDRKIEKETKSYEDKLDLLKQVLRSYQRMGPGSYIEIILDAENIANLLRRINTLRDLTKNTGELLDSIDEIKKRLIKEKVSLDQKLNLLEETEDQLAKTIEEGQQKVKEMEEYLASLEGDREYYQEQLDRLMKMIDELTLLIKDATKEFTHIIKEGDLPEEEVKLKLAGKNVKGSIREGIFNQIIKANSNLPEIIVHFYPDRVEMEFPEKELLLIGSFVVLDKQILQFKVEEGTYYGFVLKKGTIDKFFEEGDFILDIQPLIGRNVLKAVEIMDGYIELTVEIKLF
ncbi:coiled-coil domain-containing protein [Clostridium sp. Cult1]|uniref:coiled-coil domain-containing protein n=1 Tax=Clostridium sp. Cult1 TaxID=2079002 RepID=UPI001F1F4D17|nr:hypothetical protein [Clostridium sp. Cult1]MCF6462151.1 hypothetical protein [Clostridium sp. Cult1]